jgi:membrane protein insertase Oxa1/YidC/SpoIIIJ
MSLLFPIMLYNRASGLNLYICTSTTIGIIENKIIRDHIKQREEAEKSGKIIVDAGNKKRKGGGDNTLNKTAKPTGIAGWIADLKTKAEQIQREAERRGKDQA